MSSPAKPPLPDSLAVWLRASHFSSLGLGCLLSKVEIKGGRSLSPLNVFKFSKAVTPASSNIQVPVSAFLENQVSAALHPKVPPVSSPEHKVWKGVTYSLLPLEMCSQWGIIHFLHFFHEMWDPGGKAWMFQGFLVLLGWKSVSVISWRIHLPFSSPERVLRTVYLFLVLVWVSKSHFSQEWELLIWNSGWGALVSFFLPLKGGMSLSKEKKACCTRLAGSDRSQRRFACCHSQSKMPPLPRSPSATFLFCVPEMNPSWGPGLVGLTRRSPRFLQGSFSIPRRWE